MHELDRFLDRDDVPRETVVDVIDQRRQRRRFTGTSRTGHENQSAAEMRELFCHERNSKLLERSDLRWNQTKDRAIATRLFQIIAAKSRRCVHFVGEIEIAAFFENFPIPITANFA